MAVLVFVVVILIQLVLSEFSSQRKGFIDCRIEKSKLDHSEGFRFQPGYVSSVESRSIEEFIRNLETNSTYQCPPYSRDLLQSHQYATYQNEAFNASMFLSLISGKSVGVIGDSLAEQLFNALDVELFPYLDHEKSMSPGNGTHRFTGYYNGLPDIDPYPKIKAAYRYYNTFNAHLIWCKDQTITIDRKLDEFCRRRALNSDILIIGIGAHFKPGAISLDKYYKRLDEIAADLEKHLLFVRQQIYKIRGPNQQVIWRLNSHVGPIDEYNSIFKNHNYVHNVPFFWDNLLDRESEWVRRFNTVTRVVAELHRDYVMDHYTTSMALLRHEQDRVHVFLNQSGKPLVSHVPVHADSLHYCAGGLFRTTPLLLQKQIEHFHQCNHHHHQN